MSPGEALVGIEHDHCAGRAGQTEGRRWLPAGTGSAWLRAYGGVWLATLAAAALVALAGPPLQAPARRALGLTLSARRNPPPQLAHVLALAAHNTLIACWPLLLGVLGAHRHRLARHLADGLLSACILANTLPVGVALGAYGSALLPYLPQLPVEWAALALGAGGWLVQRRRALTAREGTLCTALIACLLLLAAVLETVAVPHR